MRATSTRAPPLAAHLERRLQEELVRQGVVERRPDARRLQAHREILSQLAKAFRGYSPLLTAIEQEVELYVGHLEKQAAGVMALQAQLATLRQAHARETARVRLEAQLEAGHKADKQSAVRERLADLEHENAGLKEQIKQLMRVLHEVSFTSVAGRTDHPPQPRLSKP
jgi:murein L,D-transpeptidase YcbB/YkuD